MEKLKPYAVPLVALVLTLVWFFVIRPMMDEQPAADADEVEAGQPDAKSSEPAKTQ